MSELVEIGKLILVIVIGVLLARSYSNKIKKRNREEKLNGEKEKR